MAFIAVTMGHLPLAGCSGDNSSRSWRNFKSEKYKFSAKFPHQVEITEEEHVTLFRADDDVAFRIGYSEVAPIEEKEAAQRELRGLRDSTFKDAWSVNAKDIEVQGFPAIDFTFLVNSEGAHFMFYCRYVQVNNRLYQLVVTVPEGTNAAQDIRKFFDSFQVDTN